MSTGPVAVYCASSNGVEAAYVNAAASIGKAIAPRGLVYGGGSSGLMGVVSLATLEAGGKVVGIVPAAMLAGKRGWPAGGEGSKVDVETAPTTKEELGVVKQHGEPVLLAEKGREKTETVVVSSMHERKVAMAERATGGFIGLPGGFGTFEEVLEVVTWSQLAIHNKPVVLINVLGYWDPLRALVKQGIASGFIHPQNEGLITWIDGPADRAAHADYDWGAEVVRVLDAWRPNGWTGYGFDWSRTASGHKSKGGLDAA